MTPSDVILAFRAAIGDEEEVFLHSDIEVYGYLDDAQKLFCRITGLLVDATTFASVTVTANDPVVVLSPRIIEIVRATITGRNPPLALKTVRQMDRSDFLEGEDYGTALTGTSWTSTTGTPRILVTDWAYGKGRLYPTPTANATLSLHAVVLPADVTPATATLDVVDPRHQRVMIEWMKHLAYQKDDADAFDEKESERAGAAFYTRAAQIAEEIKRSTKPAGLTGYGGL